jgi:hypothetical protein
MRAREFRRLVLLAAAALLLAAGCYGTDAPSYNPGDTSQLVQAIARRGITVTGKVGGDSACSDPALVGNALGVLLVDPDGGQSREVYVYVFEPAAWDASAAQVDACQAQFAAAHPASTVDRLDIPVFRVLGADWSDQLTDLLRQAVTEAASAGVQN